MATLELSVLSSMITPAVLISACGTLILSTSNRLSRAVDRLRRSSERILALSKADPTDSDAQLERRLLDEQIPQVFRRIRLIHRSLVAFYLSVGLFVLSSVVIGASGILGFSSDAVPVVLGVVGAAVLSYGTLLLTLEAQLSLKVNLEEMAFIQDVSHKRALEGEKAGGWERG